MCTLQLPMVPVLVQPAPQEDDVTLVKLEVAGLLPLVTAEGFATGELGEGLKENNTIAQWPSCCLVRSIWKCTFASTHSPGHLANWAMLDSGAVWAILMTPARGG